MTHRIAWYGITASHFPTVYSLPLPHIPHISGIETGSIPVNCPVRLIHGLSDEEVPMNLALKLLENCASRDSALTLLKSSTHAMEDEQDMKTMRSMILEVMTNYKGDFDLRSPGSG